MTKPLVLLTDPIDCSAMPGLAHAEVIVMPDQKPETYRRYMRDAHVLVVRSHKLPEDVLEDAPNLLGVIRHGAGLDVVPMGRAEALNIPVANVPGGNAQAVAEYGLLVMGLLSRRLHEIDAEMHLSGWVEAKARNSGTTNLAGKTVGIVGVGQVGGRLARICHAGFDMSVLGHQPDRRGMPDFVPLVELDVLFTRSDFIVLTCPLTEQTRGLCSAARLSQMKPTARLVNLARGELVDTDALIAALESGRIAGAALDVFEYEPLPSDHSLVKAGKIILTPHIAAVTRESAIYNSKLSVRQVNELLQGIAPVHLVNGVVWDRGAARRQAIRSSLAMP